MTVCYWLLYRSFIAFVAAKVVGGCCGWEVRMKEKTEQKARQQTLHNKGLQLQWTGVRWDRGWWVDWSATSLNA